MSEKGTIVVLGASKKPERYSNQAVRLLQSHDYKVIPVTPAGGEICGIDAVTALSEISEPVDTLTMYVNASRSAAMQDDIINLNARRIIFNPGTENPDLEAACEEAGSEVIEACTLVMLNTGQF